MDYNSYYLNQAGGGYEDVFRGVPIQRGYGLGGIFKRFFSWIMPIVKEHALPKIKEGAKVISSEVLNSVGNIAADAIDGRNIKESVNNNFESSVSNIKRKAEDALKGRGYKRRRNTKTKKSKSNSNKRNKKRFRKSIDIFD